MQMRRRQQAVGALSCESADAGDRATAEVVLSDHAAAAAASVASTSSAPVGVRVLSHQRSAGTLRQLLGVGGSSSKKLSAKLSSGMAGAVRALSGKSGKHEDDDDDDEALQSLDPALRALIEGLKLGATATKTALHAAAAWADEQYGSVTSIDDVRRAGDEEELATDVLKLKPKKKKIFLKDLAEAPGGAKV